MCFVRLPFSSPDPLIIFAPPFHPHPKGNKNSVVSIIVAILWATNGVPNLAVAGDLIHTTFHDSLFYVFSVLFVISTRSSLSSYFRRLISVTYLQVYTILTTVLFYVVSVGNHITPWKIDSKSWKKYFWDTLDDLVHRIWEHWKFVLLVVVTAVFAFYVGVALLSPQPCTLLELGQEYPFNHASADETMHDVLEFVTENHEKLPHRRALRGQHAKTIACVRGVFTRDDTLHPRYAVGVFGPDQPPEFAAWVRFSHSAPDFTEDGFPGPKGMAIKLLNVKGERLDTDERPDDEETQDIVLLSAPIFFAANPNVYGGFIKSFVTNDIFGWFWRHLNWPTAWETMFALFKIIRHSAAMTNPLDWDWYSTTPYRLGDHNAPIKYVAKPCDMAGSQFPRDFATTSNSHFLRDAMQLQLSKMPACFILYAQFQMNGCREPLENPTVEWRTPLHPLGKLVIPMQPFVDKEHMQYCDEMAFNPWHTLREHKPLGGVNRQRLFVYNKTSVMRSHWNNYTQTEPIAEPPFVASGPLPHLNDTTFYDRSKIASGDTMNFQFRPYVGYEIDSPRYPLGLPGHIASLVKDSQFTTEKALRIFRAAMDGVNNGVQEALADDFQLLKHPNDYTKIFHDPHMRARIPWMAKDRVWEKDSVFASQWIRGPNPMSIRRITNGKFPAEFARNLRQQDIDYLNEHVLPTNHSKVEEMLAHGRILYADYKVLDYVETPKWLSDVTVRYPALILFYIREDGRESELLPLAIQLEQWKDSECPVNATKVSVTSEEHPWACDKSLLPRKTVRFISLAICADSLDIFATQSRGARGI